MSYIPAGPASATILGSVKIGTGLTPAADGTTSVTFGTSAGTSTQGNDTRVVGSEQTANKNVASGYAGLDSSGRILSTVLPASIVGAVVYQGTWNAATNSPALASGTGTKGYYYKVSTAGTTTLDGISSWNAGDTAIYDGTTWDKIDGIANEVLSVAGRTGAVVLGGSDVTLNGTTYTAAGAIALTDDLSVVNSSSTLAMTLANGTVAHTINIKRFGSGTVTLAALIDGTQQTITMNTTGSLRETTTLYWHVALASWLLL